MSFYEENPLLTVTDEGVLLCPTGCGEIYTHIDGVMMIPCKSSEHQGVQLAASGDDENTDIHIAFVDEKNSGRRHSVILTGYCETCEQEFQIGFQQHKGLTYVETAVKPIKIYEGY